MIKFCASLTGLYLIYISSASAAEGIIDAQNHAPMAPSGGLPQFDPTWFASQVFWLIIAFSVLYFIFSKKTLPEISSVIENRKNHIQSDLETAEKLTAEADNVQEAYQKNLDKAQSNAADAIKNVEQTAKSKTENTINELRMKSDKALKEAEKNILSSKSAAMEDMNQIAIDVAAQAVEKIIGIKLNKSQIEDVVKNMNGKTSKKVKAA